MATINQKEYLKKYLGIGKAPGEKKKKKKKEKTAGNRLKIIDDDVDVLISKEIENDIEAANEDAPQIVAVIDERPISLQIDEHTNTSLWTPLGEPTSSTSDTHTLKVNSFKLSLKSSETKSKIKKELATDSYSKHTKYNRGRNSTVTKIKQEKDSDWSPERTNREKSHSPLRRNEKDYTSSPVHSRDDNSPIRKRMVDALPPKKRHGDDNYDYSPPRKSRREDNSPKRRNRDYSPPKGRKEGNSSKSRRQVRDDSPLRSKRLGGDSLAKSTNPNDSSPLRKRNINDNSPPRRRNKDSSSSKTKYREDDMSPPRKENKDRSPSRKKYKERNGSPLRRKNEEKDASPPRRKNEEKDASPPRRNKNKSSSPPRRENREDESSPPIRKHNDDSSPPRRRNRGFSPSPLSPKNVKIKSGVEVSSTSKGQRKNGAVKRSRWSPEKSPESTRKTLDGKKAGLQNSKDLVRESKHLRQKEDELFKNMSTEISGRNAATVVRGKKVKDVEEEAAREKRQKEMKEKYDRWGKGLKQVEDQNQRIQEQLHEMSKPLARYADDEDLEKFLKEQEREGDPMLAYIRKKKKKEKVAAGIPEKPMFMGEFMPNRFAIRPGYRWDGVDRSNGYEKKWFHTQNEKKAKQDEAFRWSTEDM